MSNSASILNGFLREIADAKDLRLLTPEQAMEVLQVSRRTLQEMTSRRDLPSVLVSRKCRRYPADGLRRWLAARMEGPRQ